MDRFFSWYQNLAKVLKNGISESIYVMFSELFPNLREKYCKEYFVYIAVR